MSERVVVAGAGFAGLNSALKLDSAGFDVLLIDKKRYHLFRPGLIELIRGRVSEESLKLDLDSFLKNTGVEYTCEEVKRIDPEKQVVHADIGDYEYDYLVVGLGSEKIEPNFSLKYAEDFYSLESTKEAIKKVPNCESAAVIGSGYTGIEIGAELKEKGLDVTIVDRSTRPMPRSNEESSSKVLDYLNDAEISFRGGSLVEEVTNYGVEFEDGSELNADLVIWCGGLEASQTVQDSFRADGSGVETNKGLSAVGYENVFVAGDAADTDVEKTAQNAEKQGLKVAQNICSESEVLSEFEGNGSPILVSLGNNGMLIKEDGAYQSRFFRLMKDLVIKYYFWNLKRRKYQSRISTSVKSSFSFFNVIGE